MRTRHVVVTVLLGVLLATGVALFAWHLRQVVRSRRDARPEAADSGAAEEGDR